VFGLQSIANESRATKLMTVAITNGLANMMVYWLKNYVVW
jgi:hypothetical protein